MKKTLLFISALTFNIILFSCERSNDVRDRNDDVINMPDTGARANANINMPTDKIDEHSDTTRSGNFTGASRQ